MRTLREITEDFLRDHPEWKEHTENAGTHLQWEDLEGKEGVRFLPTDLAAIRQMSREPINQKDPRQTQ